MNLSTSADRKTRTGDWIGLVRAEPSKLLVMTCGHPQPSIMLARACARRAAGALGLTVDAGK